MVKVTGAKRFTIDYLETWKLNFTMLGPDFQKILGKT